MIMYEDRNLPIHKWFGELANSEDVLDVFWMNMREKYINTKRVVIDRLSVREQPDFFDKNDVTIEYAIREADQDEDHCAG